MRLGDMSHLVLYVVHSGHLEFALEGQPGQTENCGEGSWDTLWCYSYVYQLHYHAAYVHGDGWPASIACAINHVYGFGEALQGGCCILVPTHMLCPNLT